LLTFRGCSKSRNHPTPVGLFEFPKITKIEARDLDLAILIAPARSSERDLQESLDANGGYAITHVVEVTRPSGRGFTPDEALSFIQEVYWFFSFARKSWTSPVLYAGHEKGKLCWERWEQPFYIDPWSPHPRQLTEKILNAMLSGFLRMWRNVDWRKPLESGVRWYLEAVNHRTPASALVIAQTALELLAWVYVVEHKHMVSRDGFDKLPAADRLKILLSQCGVPYERYLLRVMN
jgi:hypothetical protein